MRIDGNLPPGDWPPIGEVRHGDQVLCFVSGDLDARPNVPAIESRQGLMKLSGRDQTVSLAMLS